jgi:2-phosphosulfolactate phosphatase
VSDFDQSGYPFRLEWGWQGAEWAAERGDILVVIDTLRFSTSVITAVAHGVAIYPCLEHENVHEVAKREGAEVSGSATEGYHYTLSPDTLASAPVGTRIVLGSRNGAACSRYAERVPFLLAGALVNARAVAKAIVTLQKRTGNSVTLNPCGERWTVPNRDGSLRVALEDYLSAGAILSHIEQGLSPEAEVCASAFSGSQANLQTYLIECGSGRELCRRNERKDVVHASQLDRYSVVPQMRDGWFVPLNDEDLNI